jgi:hypothetical protein
MAMSDELTFRGEGSFEIKLQRPPTAVAEDGIVVVTLPAFAAGFPDATAQIELLLTLEDAQHLAAQLQPALTMARVQVKQGR